MRAIESILKELERIAVDNHRCFGCGREHGCGIHGCAIIREGMECIRQLQADLAQSEAARSDLGKRLAEAQQALHETKSERDAPENDLKGCCDCCNVCAYTDSNPDCDGECEKCTDRCLCYECDETASNFVWKGCRN